jgi:cytosine/adenosine deaminase-related metal-dependent hydrolase
MVPGEPEGEEPQLPEIEAGRPVVLRRGTVLTMNDAHDVLHDADVLVTGEQIAAVGRGLEVPEGTAEIDASGGIVMPGMIDTHRHMWQTALRGYGADWTLAQYFVFFYLEWGKVFRPQDIHAGNLLSALESLEAGVTTTVDWSHGLQTVDHAEAAVDALQAAPAASCSPTGTSSRARGSGRRRRTSARSSSAASAPRTTCSASSWPST